MVYIAANQDFDLAPGQENLEDQVYHRIKQAILHKEVKPGSRISSAEWADQLGVSRTPVRDTLRRLEYEGLVIRVSERLWKVYTLTLEDVNTIFDARETVEGKVSYLSAVHITDDEIAQMKQIMADMEVTHLTNDYEAFVKVNGYFHRLVNSACRNEYLGRYSAQLNERLTRVYPKGINIEGRLAKGFEENSLIANAIMAHEPEKAEQYQVAHLRSYREHLTKVIKEMVIPYSGPEF